MRSSLTRLLCLAAVFAALLLLHWPVLRLPYFWDESGYYVPAARDFYQAWRLIPQTTLPVGHPPLVMIYLGLAWRLAGYSTLVARSAMTLVAAATAALVFMLGRRVAQLEAAFWTALLLALSPLFFAQSTLVHLDLAAALFTTLAILFLLNNQLWPFAVAASLSVLAKETAVVLLPVAWLYTWYRHRGFRSQHGSPVKTWLPLVIPLLPLAAWTLYYHHATGYWTGNRGYLSYNLYSTISPVRIFWSFLRRAYELLVGGFNWMLTLGALAAIWWNQHRIRSGKLEAQVPAENPDLRDADSADELRISSCESRVPSPGSRVPVLCRRFTFLAVGLIIVYLVLLSVVGGAILPRYLLPVIPLFYLAAVAIVMRLPLRAARAILASTAALFIGAWFINPPYPFPLEDNLAYADFIRLHQQAAHFLEAEPSGRILTAWPASDELTRPILGYVQGPLRVISVEGFASRDFAGVPANSYDLIYLYSRRWEPPGNWVTRFPGWLRMQGRYFDYQPQASAEAIAARYHWHLITQMERRGQWVKIYSR